MTDRDTGAPLPPTDPDEAITSVPATDQPSYDAAPPVAEPAPVADATKPDIGKRVIAYAIDWVVAMVLYAVLAPISGPLGSLVGAAYLLLRDGFDFEFMRGRSLGKRMMKLGVDLDGGAKMDLATSAKRNWPMALSMLPLGLFWLFLAPIAGVLVLYEAYLVFTSTDGRRWGDKLAGTKVVETAE
ncbi:MAG: RDD family protein [Trueperaceae bacterium]